MRCAALGFGALLWMGQGKRVWAGLGGGEGDGIRGKEGGFSNRGNLEEELYAGTIGGVLKYEGGEIYSRAPSIEGAAILGLRIDRGAR